MNRVCFISDLHLSPERPAMQQAFHELLATAAERWEVLYVLGDLFEYWIGDDAAERIGHGETQARMREAVDRGLAIRV
ncbi:MAG: hypothetical protein GWN53_10460, partial [Gammaproteobacteria bacterium]|nr:hypothetical protein [Gammaproteobacteria bacterium]